MNQFQLNLNVNPLVYFPTKSNQPLELKKSLSFPDMFVVEVGSQEILITNEGKRSTNDLSLSVFPYTLS